jgi:Uma2 family endonuclease
LAGAENGEIPLGPDDLALVVEIADSGLQRAQVFKKSLCAQAGIPVYWIVNLVDWRVEVYTDPTGPAKDPDYRQHQDFGPTDSLPFLVERREAARLSIAELLPERPRPPASLPGT